MPFFTPEQAAQLAGSTVRLDLLVKMEFKSGPAYLWNGSTELETGGQTWKPMHGLAAIDGLGYSGSGASESITMTLSGLPESAGGLLGDAIAETQDANQQLVTVYIQLFDTEWQPVGVPITVWWGFLQTPKVTRSQMQGSEGAIQSIAVSAENAFYNRSRPPYGRYTDRDQQRRYPGDKFFQFTPSLLFATWTYPDY